MIFYTISSADGYFCGFHRRWTNWFMLRPEFRWDTIPWHGEAVTFPSREDAASYAATKLRGLHLKIAQNDTGGRDINLRPPPA